MKRLVAIALFLAAAAIPACAQRGGSHGGFSGRGASSAPAFHSGPSFSSPSHFSGVSRGPMPMARPAASARPSFYSANRYQPSHYQPSHYSGNRYPAGRPIGNRFPNHRPVPFRGIPYGFSSGISYVPYPFLDSSLFDDPSDSSYNEAPPVPYAPPAPDSAAYGYTYPQDQPPYESGPQAPAAIVRPTTHPEPAPVSTTTLIFKDGRTPEKIGNYIATRSTVTVIDGQRHHDIPVADLDIPATIRANRDTGNGFQLPAASH